MKKLQPKVDSQLSQTTDIAGQTKSFGQTSHMHEVPHDQGQATLVEFSENLEIISPTTTTTAKFSPTPGNFYQTKTNPESPNRARKKKYMTPKLQRLLATKNAEFGGKPIKSSTFMTNGFNRHKWESTAFEATNTQLVKLLHSTKSVQNRKPRNQQLTGKPDKGIQNREKSTNAKTIVNLLNPQFDLFDGLYQQGKNAYKTGAAGLTGSMVNVGDVVQEGDSSAPAAIREPDSPALSCCESDFSEFERLKDVEKQVFKPRGRETVPKYLVSDQPPEESKLCREWLRSQKPQGERPPAEAFAKIANQLYAKHLQSNSKYGDYSWRPKPNKPQTRQLKKRRMSDSRQKNSALKQQPGEIMIHTQYPNAQGEVNLEESFMNQSKKQSMINKKPTPFDQPAHIQSSVKSQSQPPLPSFRGKRSTGTVSKQEPSHMTSTLNSIEEQELKLFEEKQQEQARYKKIFGTRDFEFNLTPLEKKLTLGSTKSKRSQQRTANATGLETEDVGQASLQLSPADHKGQQGPFMVGLDNQESKSKSNKPKRAGIVGIDETVHIKTDVFVKEGALIMPQEFYRKGKQIAQQKIRIALNRDKSGSDIGQKGEQQLSAFQTRWKYDNRMRGDIQNVKAPSTIDFFKVKIDQREKYFKSLTLQSQEEVKAEQISQKTPKQSYTYANLIKRVSQDQKQQLDSVVQGTSTLNRNILPNAYATVSGAGVHNTFKAPKSRAKSRRNVKIDGLNTLIINDFNISDRGTMSPDPASPYQYSLQPQRRKTTEACNGFIDACDIQEINKRIGSAGVVPGQSPWTATITRLTTANNRISAGGGDLSQGTRDQVSRQQHRLNATMSPSSRHAGTMAKDKSPLNLRTTLTSLEATTQASGKKYISRKEHKQQEDLEASQKKTLQMYSHIKFFQDYSNVENINTSTLASTVNSKQGQRQKQHNRI